MIGLINSLPVHTFTNTIRTVGCQTIDTKQYDLI